MSALDLLSLFIHKLNFLKTKAHLPFLELRTMESCSWDVPSLLDLSQVTHLCFLSQSPSFPFCLPLLKILEPPFSFQKHFNIPRGDQVSLGTRQAYLSAWPLNLLPLHSAFPSSNTLRCEFPTVRTRAVSPVCLDTGQSPEQMLNSCLLT